MAIISDNVKRAAIEARISGRGVKEIATGLDISEASVAKWRSWARELGIVVPSGHVRKKKPFRMSVTSPAVWEMRRRAVQTRAAGGNSVEAAAASGLRLQDIRINWRAWAEHLEIEVPSAMSPEQLLREIGESDHEEEAGETSASEEDQKDEEETPVSETKSASEKILRLMGALDRMLSEYISGNNVVNRFILDVDEYNCCELSICDDEDIGERCLALEMHLSMPMQEVENV